MRWLQFSPLRLLANLDFGLASLFADAGQLDRLQGLKHPAFRFS